MTTRKWSFLKHVKVCEDIVLWCQDTELSQYQVLYQCFSVVVWCILMFAHACCVGSNVIFTILLSSQMLYVGDDRKVIFLTCWCSEDKWTTRTILMYQDVMAGSRSGVPVVCSRSHGLIIWLSLFVVCLQNAYCFKPDARNTFLFHSFADCFLDALILEDLVPQMCCVKYLISIQGVWGNMSITVDT